MTIAMLVLSVLCICVASDIRTAVDGQSDTVVILRELPGYRKVSGARVEGFDAFICGDVHRSTGAQAREARTRLAGRLTECPDRRLGAWIAFGCGGMAAPGQFGERLMRVRLVHVY